MNATGNTATPEIEKTKPAAIRIHPDDNVLISIRQIGAGEEFRFEGGSLTAREAIPMAHKIALVDLTAEAKIVRWGAPIGSATQDIPAGGLVHTHNARSDYIRTHIRQDTHGY